MFLMYMIHKDLIHDGEIFREKLHVSAKCGYFHMNDAIEFSRIFRYHSV
jgi:hypothetical protein